MVIIVLTSASIVCRGGLSHTPYLGGAVAHQGPLAFRKRAAGQCESGRLRPWNIRPPSNAALGPGTPKPEFKAAHSYKLSRVCLQRLDNVQFLAEKARKTSGNPGCGKVLQLWE